MPNEFRLRLPLIIVSLQTTQAIEVMALKNSKSSGGSVLGSFCCPHSPTAGACLPRSGADCAQWGPTGGGGWHAVLLRGAGAGLQVAVFPGAFQLQLLQRVALDGSRAEWKDRWGWQGGNHNNAFVQ